MIMKRRSFVTVTGALTFGSASLANRPSLAIQIDSPATVQTELQKAETVLVGLENIQITPNNLDDSKNLVMKINSIIEGNNVGSVMERELNFTEGEKLKIPALYVDILDNPNVTSDMLEPGNTYTLDIGLQFLFEHPQVRESQKESFTLSFTSGELDSATGFTIVQSADTRTISLESVSGTGGSEMAVWDNSRLNQNKKIADAQSFDNFASGDKGLGVFDLEGRKFGVNASQNDGESPLVKPSDDVTTGKDDPEMAVWDNTRLTQNEKIADAQSFDNFASGLKGKGVFDLEGRKFATNASDNSGKSELEEPPTEVTEGTGDPEMALWDNTRQEQMATLGSSPSFDNFATGLEGKGVTHTEGRQFSVSPSVEDGERNLSEPDSSTIN